MDMIDVLVFFMDCKMVTAIIHVDKIARAQTTSLDKK